MKTQINGSPCFAHIHVTLEPGEKIIAESDAMTSMSAELDMKAKSNGGFFSAIFLRFFGGESFFVNHFINNTADPKTVTLVQATPGDIKELELNGNTICFQPGAYVASTPDVKVSAKWAGFKSLIAGEGLFKLQVSGTGKVWYGAYGGLIEKEVDGSYIVDTNHLVAYPKGMKLKLQLAGGIFSSLFGGEGIVTRLEGKGKITIQSRSIDGLRNWVNPKI